MTRADLIAALEKLEGPFTRPLYSNQQRRDLIALAARAGLTERELDALDGALGGSLDAALTLVPEGHAWQVRHNCSRDGDDLYCNAQIWRFSDPRDDDVPRYWASHAHAAIALCIAALKARE